MPQTIWQILNHLAIWQAHQIMLLKGDKSGNVGFNEPASWMEGKYVQHQKELDERIEMLTTQIEWIQHFIESLNTHEHTPENELKIIQDMSTHLSFHLGEVVLIMHMNGDYPLAHQMKAFLAEF